VIRYLSEAEILQIHVEMLQDFGGLDGICDRNALAAAVARPQSGYYEDVIQAGAAFMRKLAAESPVCGRQQTHGYHRYDRVLRHERV
jgi:death-on-curing protein